MPTSDKFVPVVALATGEFQTVPAHWLESEVLMRGLKPADQGSEGVQDAPAAPTVAVLAPDGAVVQDAPLSPPAADTGPAPAPDAEPPTEPAEDPDPVPARSASKDEWIHYACRHGIDLEAAEGMTRKALADLFHHPEQDPTTPADQTANVPDKEQTP